PSVKHLKRVGEALAVWALDARAPRHHVAPIGLSFHGWFVGGALGRLDVLEAGGAQSFRDLGRLEEDEVEARLDSPQVFDVADLAADMKRQSQEPAGSQHSLELPEHVLQLDGLEMNDRVEGGYSSEEPVGEWQCSHVALPELDGGVQLPG